MILSRLKMKQSLLALFAVLMLAIGACRKEDFDQPPSNGVDPGLNVNMTLDSLKRVIYYADMLAKKNIVITGDWTIKGVVVADDKSGNLYKTVIIDDGTAGVALRIDISNYNTDYPIGRQVYLKLKGLVMGPYAGLVQIGGYIDSTSGSTPTLEAIPSSLVIKHLIAGTWGNTVNPYIVTIAELGNTYKWQNRLVTIFDVQFQSTDTGKVWADNVSLASVNRYMEDCFNNSLIVRTSGYSNFAGQLTPAGSGAFTGVFSVYNSDKQMILRDPSDLAMNNGRFTVGTCPPPPSVYSSIEDLRAAFASGNSVCPNVYIQGVVISDNSTGNVNSSNAYIQDNTGGIVVRFAATHSLSLGDSIKVVCSGISLSEFKGLLEVGGTTGSNTPLSYATILGTGTVIPRNATIAQLKANLTGSFDPWECTLIKLSGVTIVGGGTFSGNKIVTDGVDSITMYTAAGATFSGSNVPAGTVSITAILSEYNTPTAPNTRQQLVPRSAADVQ